MGDVAEQSAPGSGVRVSSLHAASGCCSSAAERPRRLRDMAESSGLGRCWLDETALWFPLQLLVPLVAPTEQASSGF